VVPAAPVIPQVSPALDFDTILAGAAPVVPVLPTPASAPGSRRVSLPETSTPAPVQRPLAASALPATSTAPQPTTADAEVTPFEELFGFAAPRTAGMPQQAPATQWPSAAPAANPTFYNGTREVTPASSEDTRGGGGARIFWPWFAANSSVLGAVLGAGVFALGMSLRQAFVAVLVGVAVSFLPLVLTTIAGANSAVTGAVHSRAVFGRIGAIAPALLLVVARVLWAVILIWLFGTSVSGILNASGIAPASGPVTLAISGAGLVIACALVLLGLRAIAAFQITVSVLGAVLVAGFVGITARSVDLATALTVPDAPWSIVLTGAVLVLSFGGLVWASSTADLASPRGAGGSAASTAFWATAGITLPSLVLVVYGALLAASDAELASQLTTDPFGALTSLVPGWFAVPLAAAVALPLLSGIVIVLHSGVYALQGVRGMPRGAAIAAITVLLALFGAVALAQSDFGGAIRDLATSIAVPIAAWAGIVSADTLLRSRPLDVAALARRGGVYADVRWANLIILAIATVVGFGLTSASVGWLSWQGYLFTSIGLTEGDTMSRSDIGVLVALILGVLVALVTGVASVRRQEQASSLGQQPVEARAAE
jgi:purine-cytosine permease-like protein